MGPPIASERLGLRPRSPWVAGQGPDRLRPRWASASARRGRICVRRHRGRRVGSSSQPRIRPPMTRKPDGKSEKPALSAPGREIGRGAGPAQMSDVEQIKAASSRLEASNAIIIMPEGPGFSRTVRDGLRLSLWHTIMHVLARAAFADRQPSDPDGTLRPSGTKPAMTRQGGWICRRRLRPGDGDPGRPAPADQGRTSSNTVRPPRSQAEALHDQSEGCGPGQNQPDAQEGQASARRPNRPVAFPWRRGALDFAWNIP